MRGKLRAGLLVLSGIMLGVGTPAAAQGLPHTDAIRAELRNVIAKCWATVADLAEPERLTVLVRVSLDRDGGLQEEPIVVSPVDVPAYDEDMHVAIARAVGAVKRCAPYHSLPDEHYEIWQRMTFRFMHDPQDELAIPQG